MSPLGMHYKIKHYSQLFSILRYFVKNLVVDTIAIYSNIKKSEK